MGVVGLSPNGEKEIRRKFCQVLVRKGKEQLVGGAGNHLGIPLFQQHLTDADCFVYRMACQSYVQIVRHERLELNAKQSALGQHASSLFYAVTEILGQGLVGKHNSLAKQSALFGAAYVEHIGQTSQKG